VAGAASVRLDAADEEGEEEGEEGEGEGDETRDYYVDYGEEVVEGEAAGRGRDAIDNDVSAAAALDRDSYNNNNYRKRYHGNPTSRYTLIAVKYYNNTDCL